MRCCLYDLFFTETKEIIQPHHDILCDNCKKTIIGFRYKCVTCADYDLCPKCEMQETHTHHYMIRIPKPLKFVSSSYIHYFILYGLYFVDGSLFIVLTIYQVSQILIHCLSVPQSPKRQH